MDEEVVWAEGGGLEGLDGEGGSAVLDEISAEGAGYGEFGEVV